MNRAWITGITLATVAGTGTAAYAGMHASETGGAVEAAPEQLDTTSTPATVAAPERVSFVAGPAGTVNVAHDGTAITIESVVPTSGWTLVSFSAPAAHVEAAFTDGSTVVTFLADLVGGEVMASVASTSVTTLPPETTASTPVTPAPQPAVPPVVLVPSSQPPATSHTSAPSGSGDDEDHDDEHEDEDHDEDEHEEGDDD